MFPLFEVAKRNCPVVQHIHRSCESLGPTDKSWRPPHFLDPTEFQLPDYYISPSNVQTPYAGPSWTLLTFEGAVSFRQLVTNLVLKIIYENNHYNLPAFCVIEKYLADSYVVVWSPASTIIIQFRTRRPLARQSLYDS